MRVVGLEEERLAGFDSAELAASAWLPEIDFGKFRAIGEIPVPLAIGYPNISAHVAIIRTS